MHLKFLLSPSRRRIAGSAGIGAPAAVWMAGTAILAAARAASIQGLFNLPSSLATRPNIKRRGLATGSIPLR